jgi:hypothetical protein
MSKENPTSEEILRKEEEILRKEYVEIYALMHQQYAAYSPTTKELSAILQHQYGAYGVELPDWYVQEMTQRTSAEDVALPEDAVKAAAKAIREADDAMFDDEDEDFTPTLTDAGATELASVALTAASPFMFAKIQEQQAQLEAVRAQLQEWETQEMGGEDLAALTARFAFELVCKRLRAALETVS